MLGQMASGNEIAFSLLYEKYVRQLMHYGLRFTSDVQIIEDSLHDLFVWIWHRRRELEISYSFKSYLVKSIRTTILHKLERQQRQVTFDGDENYFFEVPVVQGEAGVDAEDRLVVKKHVARAMERLTSRQREVIYLRFYEGLSFAEIAQSMDLSVKASYKLMARAVAEFKKAWQLSIPTIVIISLLAS